MGWWSWQASSPEDHSRPCLAYLVDPATREIRVVEFDGTTETAVRLLRHAPMTEDCEVCRLGGGWGELLFVDDHQPHPEQAWRLDDGQAIVGPAIFCGRTADGEPDNPPLPMPSLTRLIHWDASGGTTATPSSN